MKDVLIVSQSEICNHTRLLKAAILFSKEGYNVTVLNARTDANLSHIYNSYVESFNWVVLENKIDKSNFRSKLKWGFVSIISLVNSFLYKRGIVFLNDFVLNKGLLLCSLPENRSFDIILINLVDSLPLAVKLKRKFNCRTLIYDSQEYFKGQYSKYEKFKQKWVVENEQKFIGQCDIVVTTTYAMLDRIVSDYPDVKKVLRVRNLPLEVEELKHQTNDNNCLQLIWHGMSINYGNCRGVHIIVQALALCTTDVHLTLQGRISGNESERLLSEAKRLNVLDKLTVRPPAHPKDIVRSIANFDVGVTGELPEEDNQKLTSSNKLFDYIQAGLCTITPDLPGLSETIGEFETGEIYTPGDFVDLARILDDLNQNKNKLAHFKRNSREASKVLLWENDYRHLFELL